MSSTDTNDLGKCIRVISKATGKTIRSSINFDTKAETAELAISDVKHYLQDRLGRSCSIVEYVGPEWITLQGIHYIGWIFDAEFEDGIDCCDGVFKDGRKCTAYPNVRDSLQRQGFCRRHLVC